MTKKAYQNLGVFLAFAMAEQMASFEEVKVVDLNAESKQKRNFDNIVAIKKTQSVMRKRGLKQFTIDNVTVWALNKKNAIRKAKKIKLT